MYTLSIQILDISSLDLLHVTPPKWSFNLPVTCLLVFSQDVCISLLWNMFPCSIGGLMPAECCVCCERFSQEKAIKRTPCKHVFHEDWDVCCVRCIQINAFIAFKSQIWGAGDLKISTSIWHVKCFLQQCQVFTHKGKATECIYWNWCKLYKFVQSRNTHLLFQLDMLKHAAYRLLWCWRKKKNSWYVWPACGKSALLPWMNCMHFFLCAPRTAWQDGWRCLEKLKLMLQAMSLARPCFYYKYPRWMCVYIYDVTLSRLVW